MLIWSVFALMTGAAVLALLWPLSRGRTAAFADSADAASLYRDQIAEIERDARRGLLAPPELEAARAEAARRLLRAAGEEREPAGETEASLRRRRASSALALSCVPLLALIVYGAQGSPTMPDQPLAARASAAPDFDTALARIERHLAANPTDGRGWAVVAPVYLRAGRADDAVRAFGNAVRNGQAEPDMLAGLGEAQAAAAGGVVTQAARESFTKALAGDTGNPRARFFLAIAKEQDGDAAGAAADLKALLAAAPAGVAWAEVVRQRLAGLDADAAREAIVALPQADQQAAIRGMVAGLEGRLRASGGPLPDWQRLIRSQTMLGEIAAAKASAMLAREKLAGDAEALAAIERLVAELGLKETSP